MRIERKFKVLKERGRAALVTYVTAGDPSLDLTPEIVLKLEESGADIIELGVPFSDPMADGPAIQLASERALRSGTTLPGILDSVREIRKCSDIPIIIFGYYNPIFSYGVERFAKDASAAGVDGVLIVDLPPEEAGEFKSHTDAAGIDLVFLLSPTSTEDRVKLVSEQASGFVYLVSVTGVTGERPDMDYSLDSLVSEIRVRTDLPVGVGFGVSSPEQARGIAAFADAVIVGSAIVRIIEKMADNIEDSNREKLFKEMGEFVAGLSEACFVELSP